MSDKGFCLEDYIYFCYSLNQYLFFKEYGLKSVKRLRSCGENKYVWLFVNNDELKELRNKWRKSYPYERGNIDES